MSRAYRYDTLEKLHGGGWGSQTIDLRWERERGAHAERHLKARLVTTK